MFKIFDWAGNDKSNYYGTFSTFEDAWEAIYKEFPEDEDMYQEFYVESI